MGIKTTDPTDVVGRPSKTDRERRKEMVVRPNSQCFLFFLLLLKNLRMRVFERGGGRVGEAKEKKKRVRGDSP